MDLENVEPITQPLCGLEDKREWYCDTCVSMKKCYATRLEADEQIPHIKEVLTESLKEITAFYEKREAKKQHDLTYIEERLYKAFLIYELDPQMQYKIGPYRLDFAFIEKGIMLDVEADGLTYHAHRDQLHHDLKRNRYMQFKGWHVLRFSGRDILDDALRCAKEVNQYLDMLRSQND